jgi:hypothetical protein
VNRTRLPVEERAGSVLCRQRSTTKVEGAYGKIHGLVAFVDGTTSRIYQGGGEAANFVRWSMKAVTIDGCVWKEIADRPWDPPILLIEMIDNPSNRAWILPMAAARRGAQWYRDAKIGVRIALACDLWTVYDAAGNVYKAAGGSK